MTSPYLSLCVLSACLVCGLAMDPPGTESKQLTTSCAIPSATVTLPPAPIESVESAEEATVQLVAGSGIDARAWLSDRVRPNQLKGTMFSAGMHTRCSAYVRGLAPRDACPWEMVCHDGWNDWIGCRPTDLVQHATCRNTQPPPLDVDWDAPPIWECEREGPAVPNVTAVEVKCETWEGDVQWVRSGSCTLHYTLAPRRLWSLVTDTPILPILLVYLLWHGLRGILRIVRTWSRKVDHIGYVPLPAEQK